MSDDSDDEINELRAAALLTRPSNVRLLRSELLLLKNRYSIHTVI